MDPPSDAKRRAAYKRACALFNHFATVATTLTDKGLGSIDPQHEPPTPEEWDAACEEVEAVWLLLRQSDSLRHVFVDELGEAMLWCSKFEYQADEIDSALSTLQAEYPDWAQRVDRATFEEGVKFAAIAAHAPSAGAKWDRLSEILASVFPGWWVPNGLGEDARQAAIWNKAKGLAKRFQPSRRKE